MPQSSNVLHPGDESEGEAVRAHRQAMEELNPRTPVAEPTKSTPSAPALAPWESVKKKPAPAGEKPMYQKATEWAKPLGSYKSGTSHVPKTGVYKLHEGEAVIPKEKNTMNALDAMAGITGKAKPPKKIHKITTHKSDDGKMIHTHQHHHPAHHPDETHVSNNMKEATDHMAAMEPNMSAQPPEMPAPGADAGASGGAGASPAAAGAAGAAGASPTAQPGM
jgi:hypothetical protein